MRPSSSRHTQRGVSTVEMALLLPLLVVIFFAIIDYSRFFFLRASLTAAVMDAARTATLPGATDNGIKDVVTKELDDPINKATGQTVTVTISPSTRTSGSPVTVKADVPFSPVVLPQFLGKVLFPDSLSSTATMVVEP